MGRPLHWQGTAASREQRPGPAPQSLGAIVGLYKSSVSKAVNSRSPGEAISIWQRNYYEHMVRNENELNLIRDYIVNNPLKWELDRENIVNRQTVAQNVGDYLAEAGIS